MSSALEPNWHWWDDLNRLLGAEAVRMSELHMFIRLLAGGSESTTLAITEALKVVERAFQTACWDIYALGYPYPSQEGEAA